MTAKNTTGEEENRPPPALVYPDQASPDRWLVGAPDAAGPAPVEFSGPNACVAALEYAHRTFGCARYFSG